MGAGRTGRDGFYEMRADGSFASTKATAGPWSAGLQHGGPPSALLGRAFERCEPRPGMRIARVTVEFLGPVPVGPVRTSVRVARPGRRITLLEGELLAEDGPVLRATAWRLAAGPAAFPRQVHLPAPPPVPDEEAVPVGAWPGAYLDGYISAIEWRFVDGGFRERGPGRVWGRPRLPLVAGEENSPLVRALLLADSGSGAGNQFDLDRWLVINTELTVALHRDPAGEWVHLDARASGGPGGSGLAETVLSDETGDVGRALQTLLIAERPPAHR